MFLYKLRRGLHILGSYAKKHKLKVYTNYVQCNLRPHGTVVLAKPLNNDSFRLSRKRLFALQFQSHQSCSRLIILLFLSCHITTIYIISSPSCIYYLPIFYKSNLRIQEYRIYLQPLVPNWTRNRMITYTNLELPVWVWTIYSPYVFIIWN